MKSGCTLARFVALLAALATSVVANAEVIRDCDRPNHYILSKCEDELRLEWMPVPETLLSHGQGHAATLLDDGRVLVVGGRRPYYYDEATRAWTTTPIGAEVYDPVTRTWSLTAPMNVPRGYGVLLVRLLDGRVLALAGETVWYLRDREGSAEIFDPATGTWTRTASLTIPRTAFTATLLANGEVLVVGGVDRADETIAVAEIYNPESGTWRTTGSLRDARWGHSATIHPDGKVLVAGGLLDDWLMPPAETGELFDPGTETWSRAGSITQGWMHTATALDDGLVLVAGGTRDDISVGSTRVYVRHTGAWMDTDTLISPRHGHLAVPIPGRGLLLVGGRLGFWAPTYREAPVEPLEFFDLATWAWREVAAINELPGSASNYYSATPLADGTVLLIGDVEGKRAVQLRY